MIRIAVLLYTLPYLEMEYFSTPTMVLFPHLLSGDVFFKIRNDSLNVVNERKNSAETCCAMLSSRKAYHLNRP